jgi:hypothetical protein
MDRFRKFVCIELTRVGISRKPLTVRRALGEAAPARQVSMGSRRATPAAVATSRLAGRRRVVGFPVPVYLRSGGDPGLGEQF